MRLKIVISFLIIVLFNFKYSNVHCQVDTIRNNDIEFDITHQSIGDHGEMIAPKHNVLILSPKIDFDKISNETLKLLLKNFETTERDYASHLILCQYFEKDVLAIIPSEESWRHIQKSKDKEYWESLINK